MTRPLGAVIARLSAPISAAIRAGLVCAAALVLSFALAGPARAAEGDGAAVLMNKGLEELDSWDVEAAAATLGELLSRSPGSAEAAYLRGRVLFEQGKYEEAVKAFEEAKARSDHGPGAFEEPLRLARSAAEEVRGAVPVESDHFVFVAKAEKDRLLAPHALSALEKAYAALTRDLGYQPPGKMRLEVYDSPQALARVSPLTVAEIKGSGTIALCKYNRLMITSPRALLRGYPWMDTVSHEFVHYLVSRKGHNTVPIWLQEGLAKFLETRWRGEPGQAVDDLQDALLYKAAKGKELIPFSAMHPSIAKLPTQEKAALAFAEVEAAMRLLYTRSGQAGLTELVAAMGAGMTDEQAVAQAYGKGFREFEADWRADVAKPRGRLALKLSQNPAAQRKGMRKLVFKDDVKGQKAGPDAGAESPDGELNPHAAEPKDPAARKAARLGDLLFARRRFAAAALEYQRARAALPEEDPVIARRYAFSELQAGKVDSAEAALRRAVAKDPSDPTVQVLFAEVLEKKGQHAEAQGALEAAVAVDPFDPRLHAVWHQVALATADEKLRAREEEALLLLAGRHGREEGAAAKGGPQSRPQQAQQAGPQPGAPQTAPEPNQSRAKDTTP
jgi:tetratricopeptide (TPR) repeat protein